MGICSWWNEWDFGLFNGVIAANLLIDKLAGCNLSADFVNSISAEARFYRAIFYYHLFMGYEQFPLIKHYLAASEMYSVAKGTREEIYEFMMGDLDDEVTKYLPSAVLHSRDAFAGMLPSCFVPKLFCSIVMRLNIRWH